MLTIDIPGLGRLDLKHLVLDVNGTLPCDGELIAGVGERVADAPRAPKPWPRSLRATAPPF